LEKNSNLVQSLARGIVGLEMAANGEVSPKELAERLGIDRSSAYRLLYTLMDCGYLIQDPQTRSFVPNSVKFLSLSGKIVSKLDWLKLADQQLKKLRDETRETANLGLLEKNHLIYVKQELSDNAVRVFNILGVERPVHSSSLGKAIVAFLDEPALSKLLDEIELTARTPKTITNKDIFRLHLEMVRKQGYALDDEENYEGVRCIAAPIFGYDGQIIASMGISGPTSRITLDKMPSYIEHVLRATSELSEKLGYVPPQSR